MSKLILNSECRLYVRDGQAVYSTRAVAEEFEKRHANVLQSYDELVETANKADESNVAELKNQLSKKFIAENFFENKYKDVSGKMSREILMTRNGASVLVMGFTGKKALRFKIELMERFEHMELFIESLNNARIEHPAFTDAIMNSREHVMHYHFSNEADMINRIVLGMSAKQFREQHGIGKGISIRPYLTTDQIKGIEALQRADIGLLFAEPNNFDLRKDKLTQYFMRIMKTPAIASQAKERTPSLRPERRRTSRNQPIAQE